MVRDASGPRTGRTVEEWVRLADEAAGEQRWRDALELTTGALAIAPTSVRLLMNKGFFLERVGQFDEAHGAYQAAAAHAPFDGEADLHLALFILSNGLALEEAETALIRALRKSPNIADDVGDDASLALLLARPHVQVELTRARTRLDRASTRNRQQGG